MVAAAALLVLAGLGMFVLGITTGVAAWSWACLGACVAAGVLLAVARRRTPPAPPAGGRSPAAARPASPAMTATGQPAPVTGAAPATGPARDRDTGEDTGDGARTASGDGPAGDDATAAPARGPAPRPAPRGTAPAAQGTEPPEEDGEVTDLLLVVDLPDEVLVVDGHPRYHRDGCRWLAGRDVVPLPVREAREDGFSPCAACAPDAALAALERARRRH